nr:hypothetical protein PU94_10355 [Coprobacter secundus]
MRKDKFAYKRTTFSRYIKAKGAIIAFQAKVNKRKNENVHLTSDAIKHLIKQKCFIEGAFSYIYV